VANLAFRLILQWFPVATRVIFCGRGVVVCGRAADFVATGHIVGHSIFWRVASAGR
jgi:hypothetical protein